MGRLLATGDLTALLVKVKGLPKLKEVMDRAGLKDVVDNPMIDGVGFDLVRQSVWQALRDYYQAKLDPKALKGHLLGDTENPAAY
ncbi:hypothetical protein chiPu_0003584 [Chiloscyllium punctatum]|uniref:Uncharacterized protein n=1 Tax=Chiloscyllium punctatum TaxID=137246 RepID=A0A401S469_CHIPU|nr:hypothetical protein [Chiloscyllium punctatum]